MGEAVGEVLGRHHVRHAPRHHEGGRVDFEVHLACPFFHEGNLEGDGLTLASHFQRRKVSSAPPRTATRALPAKPGPPIDPYTSLNILSA